MRNFRNYGVWIKSNQCTLEGYKISKKNPKDEMFGLISQLRRDSNPTNIASAAEVAYLIEFYENTEYVQDKEFEILNSNIVEIRKMLNVLHSTVKKG
ncbi:four helix bundle protein [Aquimarina pacifica]|uniref:four helix bundle protein n=1 Tax=Aquimarina pacifica TaxID=1296415 RepID=UPI000471612A|nr:four helix bundle protein [Aquimarina pacifica]